VPPKIDPYATPRAHVFDAVLILFAILVIAIAIFTAPQHQSRSGPSTRPTVSDSPVMLASNVGR
jgi:hypothetical protein